MNSLRGSDVSGILCLCIQNSLGLKADLKTDARKEDRQLVILENSN